MWLALLICSAWGCSNQSGSKSRPAEKKQQVAQKKEKPALRVCLGAMITPKQGRKYYQRLLDYIAKKLDRPIKRVEKTTYAEVNRMLRTDQIDFAFVCAQPYVDGHREFGLELLVAPQVKGETVYYSYIIVPKDSKAKSLADLKGKRFAFTDPKSNSGCLVPTYMLAQKGETPDSFFSEYIYSYAHDKSIKLVANGLVDGAAVDSLIWEYLNQFDPTHTTRTKIVQKSSPYGIPPVVVRPNLDKKTKRELRRIFLNMHLDPQGRNILQGMLIDKFVPVDDSLYDSIRQMQAYISARAAGQKQ